MASFEHRGNSVRAIVRIPGTTKKLTATFDTEAEARGWARLTEAQHKNKSGAQILAMGRLVSDLFELYLDSEGGRADGARWNRIRLNSMSQEWLGQMRVSEVRPHDINRWISERLATVSKQTGAPVSPSTVNREVNLLSAAFRYAVKSLQWLDTNPCHGVTRPESGDARDRPLLTPAEILAIRKATGYDDDPQLATLTARVGAAFLLALETGLRSGEMLRIRPVDIDLDRAVLRVTARERGGRKTTKSGRLRGRVGRDVPLTPRALELIRQLLVIVPADQPVRDGQEYPPYLIGVSDSTRDALWRKARDRSGVTDLTFHDSKHEACTRLSKYIDVIALSHAIGTKDLRLLRDTYYQNDAAALAKTLPTSLLGNDDAA